MELTGKTILVIGANGAFGHEFCGKLLAAGAQVIGTARTANSSVRLRADLSERLLVDLEDTESITRLTNYLLEKADLIDGIILAAGLVGFGSIGATSPNDISRLMQVNALGQIQLVESLIPKLRQSADGGRSPFVISISGVIAERPLANLAAYSASKTAIRGYSQAASKEYKKVGITWIDARPGHTESGLAERSIFGKAPNFGTGLQVSAVVGRILQGVTAGEADLPSDTFL